MVYSLWVMGRGFLDHTARPLASRSAFEGTEPIIDSVGTLMILPI